MKRRLKRIAIFSHRHLGDTLFVEPIVRILQNASFDVVLFVRSSGAKKIAEYFFSRPKKIVILEAKTYREDIQRVKEEHCEAAILLNFSLWAALVSFFALIPKRFGRSYEMRGIFLTRSYIIKEKIHALDYHKKALELFQNYFRLHLLEKVDFPKLMLKNEALVKKPMILFQLGTTRESKKIPIKIYRELIIGVKEILKKLRLKKSLVLCGDDEMAGKDLESLIDENLVGKTNLEEYIQLIAEAEAIFSSDTSAIHIAAGFDLKIFGFYGSTSEKDYGPLSHKAFIFSKNYECQPCYKNDCLYAKNDEKYLRCLNTIDVQKYLKAFESSFSKEL